MMPDIISFENAYFRIGIGGWVVGSRAPYQKVIDKVYSEFYGIPTPPRFLLNSIPIYRGIGDPDNGYGRTTLLRALIESSPQELYEKLMSPWKENSYIKSNFMEVI